MLLLDFLHTFSQQPNGSLRIQKERERERERDI